MVAVASIGGRCVRAVLPVVLRTLTRSPLSGLIGAVALGWLAAGLLAGSPAPGSAAVVESPAVHPVAAVRTLGVPTSLGAGGSLGSCSDSSSGGSCGSPMVVPPVGTSGSSSSGDTGYPPRPDRCAAARLDRPRLAEPGLFAE